jgi:hypothetical protein
MSKPMSKRSASRSLLLIAAIAASSPATLGAQAEQETLETARITVVSPAEGVEVYIGPATLGSSVPNEALGFNTPELLVGSTYSQGAPPVTLAVPPGEHYVAVMTHDVPAEVQKRYGSSGSPGIAVIAGCMTLSSPENPGEEIVLVTRSSTIVWGGKLLKVSVAANEEKRLEVADLFAFVE